MTGIWFGPPVTLAATATAMASVATAAKLVTHGVDLGLLAVVLEHRSQTSRAAVGGRQLRDERNLAAPAHAQSAQDGALGLVGFGTTRHGSPTV